MGGGGLFLTFSATSDDTIRTYLPKEIRLALRSYKALFYQGGLLLTVTSFVAAPPAFIFHIVLLIFFYMKQADQVSSSIERPRQVSDVIADIAPRGHTP